MCMFLCACDCMGETVSLESLIHISHWFLVMCICMWGESLCVYVCICTVSLCVVFPCVYGV